MDSEAWLWFWVSAAVFLAVAEIFTAGFFMLPFAIGAAAAAVMAFFEVGEIPQLLVFLSLSAVSLWVLRRYVGARARVIEAVDPSSGVGRVRMDAETWRASTDGDRIEEGTEVRVIEVRGTRLVVEPIE
jgi:membrane protein implicated in regulation of membrane protease activity